MRHFREIVTKVVCVVCAICVYFPLLWRWGIIKRPMLFYREYQGFKNTRKKLIISPLLNSHRVGAREAFELIKRKEEGCCFGDWSIPTKEQLDSLQGEILNNEHEIVSLIGAGHFFVWIFDDCRRWWFGYNPLTGVFAQRESGSGFFDNDTDTVSYSVIPEKERYFVYAVRLVPESVKEP